MASFDVAGQRACIVAFLALAQGLASHALDPAKSIDQYVHTAWTTEDGLPQNSVNDILQTRDGYLWIATFGGLARFDGVRFTIFDAGSSPGLDSNRLTALYEDHAGRLWIGSEDGLVSYATGSPPVFTTITSPADRQPGSVHQIAEDDDGSLLIAATNSLWRLRGLESGWKSLLPSELPGQAVGLGRDSQGRLLIGGAGSLTRRDEKGRFTVFDLNNHQPPLHWFHTFIPHPEGGLWVGTSSGLARWQRDTLQPVFLRSTPGAFTRGDLVVDRDGNFWVTVAGDLHRLTGDRISTLELDGRVRVLYEDNEGNLWIGSDGGGLYRLHDGAFTSFGAAHGFSDAGVLPILETTTGEIWLGTRCDGFFRFREQQFSRVDLPHYFDCSSALLEDTKNRIWLGGNGLAIWQNEAAEIVWSTDDHLTSNDGLASNSVWALYEDRQGTIWAGLLGDGLVQLNDTELVQAYTMAHGLVDNDVRFLTEDHAGNLWIGTRHGLSRMTGRGSEAEFTNFTQTNGLPHGFVREILEDPSRNGLWLGTYGGGLAWLDTQNHHLTVLSSRSGLPENIASRILDDDNGYLWLAGNRGITRLKRADAEEYVRGHRQQVLGTLYGKADGMASAETNGGGQPAGWKTSTGQLWFPTIRGVTVVDPTRLRPETIPPVHIERVLINQEEQLLAQKLLAGPGRNQLEVHYTGLQYALAKEVRFRFRLLGLDDQWQEVGGRRTAYLAPVPPGKYVFEVSATAYEGGEWSQPASFKIEFEPHIWQTKWLQTLLLFLVALIAGSRLRAFLKRERALKAEVERRKKIEAEKQKAIDELENKNAEMERFVYTVSHDLKSPLFTIRGFLGMLRRDVQNDDQPSFEKDMERIENATGQMESLLNDLVQLSRAGHMKLNLQDVGLAALFDEALERTHGHIQERGVEVVLVDDLGTVRVDVDRILEVLQNLIENAVRFMGDQPQPCLEIGRTGKKDAALFYIRDNGIGIEPRYQEKIFGLFERLDSGVEGTGIGLAIARRIVQLHGGSIWVESDGVGKGSTFWITLPTRKNRT